MKGKLFLCGALLVAATPFASQNAAAQSREVPIFSEARALGNWREVRNVSIGGRSFERALVANVSNGFEVSLQIPVARRYDRFRAWVGTRANAQPRDENTFRVYGDGRLLFTSRALRKRDAAQRVDVSVRDVSTIRLEVSHRGRTTNSAAFGNPVFVDSGFGGGTVNPVPPIGGRNRMVVRQLFSGGYSVEINGRMIDFGSVEPQARVGRVLVPMRRIFEEIGASVVYDPPTQRIEARRGNRVIEMRLGSTQAYVNNRLVTLEVPAQATLGTTLVPLRFISEALDVVVEYEPTRLRSG